MYYCSATNTWTQIAAGPGGGGTPSAPANSVQFNNAGSFGGNANLSWDNSAHTLSVGTTNSINIQAISNPSQLAVTPTCSGTCVTNYGYQIVIYNGTGWTEPSPIKTVANAVSLDGTHFNTITFPTVSNAACLLIRTVGVTVVNLPLPTADNSAQFPRCNGASVVDDGSGDPGTTLLSLPAQNTTTGSRFGTFGMGAAGDPSLGRLTASLTGGPNPNNTQVTQTGGKNLTMIANINNIDVVDMTGSIRSNAYLGAEFDGTNYYIETGNFQTDNTSGSAPVITDSSNFLASGTYHGNTTRFQTSDNTGTSQFLAAFDASGNITNSAGTGVAFASLGTPANGAAVSCSDCTVTSGSDNTCAASGTGAYAVRVNGAWKCLQ